MGGRDRQISEFKASLVYKVSSRTARAEKPVSKKPKTKPKEKKKKMVMAIYAVILGWRV